MSDMIPEDSEKSQEVDAEKLLKQIESEIQSKRAAKKALSDAHANRQILLLAIIVTVALSAIGVLYFMLKEMESDHPKNGIPAAEESR